MKMHMGRVLGVGVLVAFILALFVLFTCTYTVFLLLTVNNIP